jgi:hypothetical protein
VCLNCAYVMEFFLQTLVKRGYESQMWMLCMQQLLMLLSTVAALQVLWYHVHPVLAAVSLVLNFTNRGREPANIMLLLGLSLALRFAGLVAV